MTILLSTGIWPVEDWQRPLAKLAPERRVVVAGSNDYDPAEVRYALAWKPPEVLLAGLPNLPVCLAVTSSFAVVMFGWSLLASRRRTTGDLL